jgi:hypothetical protein
MLAPDASPFEFCLVTDNQFAIRIGKLDLDFSPGVEKRAASPGENLPDWKK